MRSVKPTMNARLFTLVRMRLVKSAPVVSDVIFMLRLKGLMALRLMLSLSSFRKARLMPSVWTLKPPERPCRVMPEVLPK